VSALGQKQTRALQKRPGSGAASRTIGVAGIAAPSTSFIIQATMWVVGGKCLSKVAIGLVFVSIAIAACSQESSENDAERTCALNLYPSYDVTRLDQCMAVCKSCRGGNTVTCSTSCKLKGATDL